MPFEKRTVMEQKHEFVVLSKQKEISFSELCRRYGISRKTGYKWVKRYDSEGLNGLHEQSRRPKNHPLKTCKQKEELIIALRKENPEWGAKKLHRLLENDQFTGEYVYSEVPARSTINKVLKRNGLIQPKKSEMAKSWKRFEYESPNALWQMDFKGYFTMFNRSRCHPLTITDDHSRFNIGLIACKNQTYNTVKDELTQVFRAYGLPEMILADNGSPWGSTGACTADGDRAYTKLERWLILLNVKIIHGRPYHPQTQGKEERFHRTLKTELLNYETFKNQNHCQAGFDKWRYKYNHQRPHEALGFDTPASRYTPSDIAFPEKLIKPEYNSTDIVRRVDQKGIISYKNKLHRVGKAFAGEYVALRPTIKDGVIEVYFCNNNIRIINL